MKLLTTLTLILLTAIAVFAQNEAPAKDTTFKDTKNRFSVTYPTDWQSVPPDEGSEFKLRKRFGIYGWHESVIVFGVTYLESETNTPRETLIQNIERNLDSIEAGAVPPAKLVANGRTRLAGRDAFFIEMLTTPRGARQNGRFLFRSILTWESGYHYTVSLAADEHTFKQAFAEFERIISTFNID